LADCDLNDAAQRLHSVVDKVIHEAFESAQLSDHERRETGLFLGTSSFDISITEQEYRDELKQNPSALLMRTHSSQGILGDTLRKRHELHGPDFSFNTACTASANALMYADAMIRAGRIKHALVLGVELHNSLTALGFHGLQLLTNSTMKPFDRSRNGLVLGEGCSAVVLGSRRSSQHHWHLKGSANICDTHSVSATNPDGSVVANVIGNALNNASLRPQDIAAIKVHGTASLLNDEAEAAGMKRIFNEVPPLAAIKPFIGHTLGACGLNELLLFCAAADEGFLVATPGIGNNMEETGDAKLGVSLNQRICDLAPGNYLMNYFGFGGNNTALVISNIRE
jgi:3-oxoacyl-[acyl-carrier-protein] synthase-1